MAYAEREQGITIDVAYRYFETDKCKFIIADTPDIKNIQEIWQLEHLIQMLVLF